MSAVIAIGVSRLRITRRGTGGEETAKAKFDVETTDRMEEDETKDIAPLPSQW